MSTSTATTTATSTSTSTSTNTNTNTNTAAAAAAMRARASCEPVERAAVLEDAVITHSGDDSCASHRFSSRHRLLARARECLRDEPADCSRAAETARRVGRYAVRCSHARGNRRQLTPLRALRRRRRRRLPREGKRNRNWCG
eukprot:4093326-Pleurochrysis_carterae.AAC.2